MAVMDSDLTRLPSYYYNMYYHGGCAIFTAINHPWRYVRVLQLVCVCAPQGLSSLRITSTLILLWYQITIYFDGGAGDELRKSEFVLINQHLKSTNRRNVKEIHICDCVTALIRRMFHLKPTAETEIHLAKYWNENNILVINLIFLWKFASDHSSKSFINLLDIRAQRYTQLNGIYYSLVN